MSVSVLVARNELVSLIVPLPGMQRAVVIELKSRIVRVLNVTDPSAVKTGKEHAARVTLGPKSPHQWNVNPNRTTLPRNLRSIASSSNS